MAEHDDAEKNEPASPERRKKAREEGQFPRAKDAGATVASVAVLLCLAGMAPTLATSLRDLCVRAFADPTSLMRGDPRAVTALAARAGMLLVAPTALVAAVTAAAIGIAEAGYHPNLDLVAPKWSRLDPISRLGNMLSPKEMAGNVTILLLRVVVVGIVAYHTLKDEFPKLSRLSRAGLTTAAAAGATSLLRLGVWSSLALVAIGAVDYLHSWFKHEKQLMMSRQEIKDEMKQHEGDPAVKGRQRSRAREILRRGLRKQLKRADVVIANPTHVSVALRYRASEGAPVVVAKGVDDVALFIRELAKEFSVPVVENVPLARALNAQVKVGKTIPVDLYRAVAEVLAFVYRLSARRSGGVRARA